MAGYSPKSLSDKLGVAGMRKPSAGKTGDLPARRVLFVAVPPGYAETLGPLPPGIPVSIAGLSRAIALETIKKGISGALRPPFAFIQIFCRTESDLEPAIPILKKRLAYDGMLWISWPKLVKGRKLQPGELNETRVRALGLAAGLVDVKVCAIDGTWSGLKFVFRLTDRP